MDQRGVERLLLRLVERVGESERRYSQALEDLQARLDRLSQSAGAARATSAPDDTLERLHAQIDRLGRALDPDQIPLDDFERLGRVLSENAGYAGGSSHTRAPDLGFSGSRPPYAPPPSSFGSEEWNLDKRLVETAQRLERSIGTAMPEAALESLNARLDDIASQLGQALAHAPRHESLQKVERQLSEIAQQLVRAERQLAKLGNIESQLIKLIGRVEEKTVQPRPAPFDPVQLQDVANKAAAEAARRVASEGKTGTAERLDAMQRDLMAVRDRSRQSDDRLDSKLQAVHDSLKQLLEQMEKGAVAFPANKTPFERRGGAIPDTKGSKPAPAFSPNWTEAKDADLDTPADLVAAARRGAEEAALRASETATSGTASESEIGSRRTRSLLIVAAAILLTLSAAVLLYERLKMKPSLDTAPAAIEQTIPVPTPPDANGPPVPRAEGDIPSQDEPGAATLYLERPESWAPRTESEESDAASQVGDAGSVTDIAKSVQPVSAAPEGEPLLESQIAALQPGQVALPPGVVFSFEGPAVGGAGKAGASEISGATVPASLPLPPVALGSLALREAAAKGDPRAQYAIARRYAEGKVVSPDLTEARLWFERAAGAGYAPAQYRLGMLYERGQGVDRDLGRARSWYQAAAEKGHVKAMHDLAIVASGREDGNADYALAAKWHEEAASYGFGDSQFSLGILFEYGLGRPKDFTMAYQWFALAALSGDADAAKRRDQVMVKLDQAALAEAELAVQAWRAKDILPDANEAPENSAWDMPVEEPNPALVTG
jgi:localization factor PodJL